MCADGIDRSGDPNGIVRAKALELEKASRQARMVGIALNVTIGALMLAAAAFSGWNTYRLKEISERVEADAQFNRELVRIIQNYNEAHAQAAGESFTTLADALACSISLFTRAEFPTEAQVRSCYRPVTPQPAPPPEPPLEKKGQP